MCDANLTEEQLGCLSRNIRIPGQVCQLLVSREWSSILPLRVVGPTSPPNQTVPLTQRNKVPFFLGQWSVPDRQPIYSQFPVPSDPVNALAQDDVSTCLGHGRLRISLITVTLQYIVNVQLGSNVFPIDGLSNQTNMQNKKRILF